MTAQPLPPVSFLNECFEINDKSPSGLKWKNRPRYHFATLRGWKISNTRDAGNNAGSEFKSGDGIPSYGVKICQKKYPAHRIVFAINSGFDPFPLEVDHIDRNTLNNSPNNLRTAKREENARNKNTPLNNTSSVRGVTWCKRTKRWMAQIGHMRKCVFLGRFENFDDAKNARINAELKLHQEFSPLQSTPLKTELQK